MAEATDDETTYYIWGLDLSGSLQGAGGISGLLASYSSNTLHYYFYDANGNVTDVPGADGESAAHYEYGHRGLGHRGLAIGVSL